MPNRSSSFYDKLSDLNDSLYTIKDQYDGWQVLDKYTDKTGVYIVVFDIGKGETLFAIKGTDAKASVNGIRDGKADYALKNNHIPAQYYHAAIYYKQIKSKYKTIIFTGYSLGGSIAQMLGNEFGNETITFEAYGTGKMVSPKHKDKIINFGNIYDAVFMEEPNEHIGEVYLIPVKPIIKTRSLETHLPFKHGKPSQGELCKTYLMPNKEYFEQQKNMYKKYLKDGIVNTKKDLSNFKKQVTAHVKDNLKSLIHHTE